MVESVLPALLGIVAAAITGNWFATRSTRALHRLEREVALYNALPAILTRREDLAAVIDWSIRDYSCSGRAARTIELTATARRTRRAHRLPEGKRVVLKGAAWARMPGSRLCLGFGGAVPLLGSQWASTTDRY